MMKQRIIAVIIFMLPLPLLAKIDLVTLPTRDQVQLTIYNAADLTLVRERRTLTLKQGLNRLEFSWAETLIDPTSVQLEAPQHAQQVKLLEVSYLPNVNGSAIWTIESQIAGEVPVEITFFTSGISWQAFYMATLATDEQTMQLQNYVRVNNHSGENYDNAQTRVVIGEIHLLDEIAQLAKRFPPYGSPVPMIPLYAASPEPQTRKSLRAPETAAAEMNDSITLSMKEIMKEGLSEYFLYTIEGTESIAHGWGKRLLSLEVTNIPVKALYRYDETRYGTQTQQLLFFKNDKPHRLGETPLPEGKITIYRQLAENQQLSYIYATTVQYIPVEQEVELNLGNARQVNIEPILMDYKTENYVFDRDGHISGFDQVQQWQLKLANNRDLPVDIEIFRHLDHPYWQIKNAEGMTATYEKVDMDTVKYRLTLPAHTKEQFLTYTLTLSEGERRRHSS
jgi:hypothetical protein